MKRTVFALGLCLSACSSSHPAPSAAVAASLEPCTRIEHARVFDGEHTLPDAAVTFRDGRIAEVNGPTRCREVLSGAGKTLLPGLIDSHTHAWEPAQLEAALRFGVTTELDMMTSPVSAASLKKAAASRTDVADFRSAGSPVTAKGGHGTEYGFVVPTLDRPEDADAFVAQRVAEGSDYIKVIYTPDSTFFRSISRETLEAAVAAAHRRSLLVVVHVDTLRGATDAIAAGADGLAHLFHDVVATHDVVALAKEKGAFVVPTLSVLRTIADKPQGPELLEDERLRAKLAPAEQRSLRAKFPFHAHDEDGSTVAPSVRALKEGGVPILAGTDAPNPGTYHGVSLHGELELLVASGLTPVEALAAATSAPAKAFRLSDRGRIAPGFRADLVLVDGDPTTDIRATRNLRAVWRAGVRLEEKPLAPDSAEKEETEGKDLPVPRRAPGVISTFDKDASASFGLGWKETTDVIMGGKSVASMRVAKGALDVSGAVTGDIAYAWSGVMFNPGDAMFAPVDLSAAKELVFRARGDERRYQVLLFTKKGGRVAARQTFVATKGWKEHRLPLTAFGGTDATDVQGIAFVAGPSPCKYRFQLDSVALR